jgi:dTDP-4-dehydrorhamnose 3,5-epimerase
VIVVPKVFGDERGFFLEVYSQATFAKLGLPTEFVQDNHSGSQKGVLRGLHYQIQQPQGKLVRALRGGIFDVAVDLRRDSKQFGQWVGVELSAENKRQLWVPPGFAHGFLTLTEFAEVSYKVTSLYAPEHERSLLWSDPALGIGWPLAGEPILSAKDRAGVPLADAETYDSSSLD